MHALDGGVVHAGGGDGRPHKLANGDRTRSIVECLLSGKCAGEDEHPVVADVGMQYGQGLLAANPADVLRGCKGAVFNLQPGGQQILDHDIVEAARRFKGGFHDVEFALPEGEGVGGGAVELQQLTSCRDAPVEFLGAAVGGDAFGFPVVVEGSFAKVLNRDVAAIEAGLKLFLVFKRDGVDPSGDGFLLAGKMQGVFSQRHQGNGVFLGVSPAGGVQPPRQHGNPFVLRVGIEKDGEQKGIVADGGAQAAADFAREGDGGVDADGVEQFQRLPPLARGDKRGGEVDLRAPPKLFLLPAKAGHCAVLRSSCKCQNVAGVGAVVGLSAIYPFFQIVERSVQAFLRHVVLRGGLHQEMRGIDGAPDVGVGVRP